LAAAKAAAALETVTERDEPPSSRLEDQDGEPSNEDDPSRIVASDTSVPNEQTTEDAEMEEEEEEEVSDCIYIRVIGILTGCR